MLMGLDGLNMLEVAYFDKNDKLAHDLLVHMFGHEHLDELKERWGQLPNYASKRRLNAQEAHEKYKPIPNPR